MTPDTSRARTQAAVRVRARRRPVPAQVAHGVERHSQAPIRLRRRHTHQQGTRQPGSDGGRDDIGLARPPPASARRIAGPSASQVRPGGDLGHHAAEADVLVDAERRLVGQPRSRSPRDRSRLGVRYPDTSFVAGGFDGQDCRPGRHSGSPGSLRSGVSVGAADPVVAPTQADLVESHAAVQRDGRLVVGADLQVDDTARGENPAAR